MIQRLFRKNYSEQEKHLFEFLKYNRLFANLLKNEMHPFTEHIYLRNYSKNEVVFFRNDPSQAIYLVKTGRVALRIDVAEHFETFATIEPYASFGNNALLNDTKRLYSAVVRSDECQLYVIPQVSIQTIFRHRPKIKAKMISALAEIYHENTANLLQSYQSTFGFFDLKQIHKNLAYGE